MRVASVAIVGALALAAGGCASGMQCQRSSEPDRSEECVATGGSGEAAGTAIAAAGAWAVTGCRVNGCNLPYTCNQDTGMCERISCAEGQSCPPGYHCDPDDERCE